MLGFGILGINMFGGVMYRECRPLEQPNPILTDLNGMQCWSFPLDEENERLCGGSLGYQCASVDKGDGAFLGIYNGDGTQHGICKSSYTADADPKFRPEFKIGDEVRNDLEPTFRNNWGHDEGFFPWCYDIEERPNPFKLERPHRQGGYNYGLTRFDDLGKALIVIFQCITMEGWVDVMYMVQDSGGYESAAVYFVCLFLLGSVFLLNVALAVVATAYSTLDAENSSRAVLLIGNKKVGKSSLIAALSRPPTQPQEVGYKYKATDKVAVHRCKFAIQVSKDDPPDKAQQVQF